MRSTAADCSTVVNPASYMRVTWKTVTDFLDKYMESRNALPRAASSGLELLWLCNHVLEPTTFWLAVDVLRLPRLSRVRRERRKKS